MQIIFSGLTLLSHWTVPPFLFLSVCLCLYYSTFFLIVNTFFEKNLNFFILPVLSILFLNFQKIQTIYQSSFVLLLPQAQCKMKAEYQQEENRRTLS